MSIVEIDQGPKQEAAGGIVTGRTGSVYQVTTASGRIVRAESAEPWAVGTPVIVVGGQIVGRAGLVRPSRVYEV
jgi:hypothetical protein